MAPVENPQAMSATRYKFLSVNEVCSALKESMNPGYERFRKVFIFSYVCFSGKWLSIISFILAASVLVEP